MATIAPSLLKLVGQGFRDDGFAADGTHLRWMFDTRLGFPRLAFCLERRPSVITNEGQEIEIHGVDFRNFVGTAFTSEIVLDGVTARRPGGPMTVTRDGITLSSAPVRLRFTGTDGHASWVELTLVLREPGGTAEAVAEYVNRGDVTPVDVARVGFPGRPILAGGVPTRALRRLARVLRNPEPAGARPVGLPRPLRVLHARLIAADPRLARVTRQWLGAVLAELGRLDAQPEDLDGELRLARTVTLVLTADRIDAVTVSGGLGHLTSMRWIGTEALMGDRRWQPVGCFPAATAEPDYFSRNEPDYGGLSPQQLARNRVFVPMPRGAEPLDTGAVPPARPPTPDERERRYLEPWESELAPWFADVMRESLGGTRHQSEVKVTTDLTDAGQRRGQGIPPLLAAKRHRMTFAPYDGLLAASLAFPVAQLLGLGCVLTDVPDQPMDYRLRGRWLVEDLQAVADAAIRRVERLVGALAEAKPAERDAAETALIAAMTEGAQTAAFLGPLIAETIESQTEVAELWALRIGVVPAPRPAFAGPGPVAVAEDGLGLPPDHAGEAVAAVTWPLRQRNRTLVDEAIPLGACIVRGPDGGVGPFAEVRNPTRHGSAPPVAIAVLPSGPEGAPGLPGTARFRDRYAEDGRGYRYGVSECDPFGRWSAFSEAPFRWDDRTPPVAPFEVTAELELAGLPAALRLTVDFSWPSDLADPDAMGFELHLSRVAPPSADAHDRAHWGRLERVAGTGGTPFAFAGSASGPAGHDGMSVSISQADEQRPDPSGGPDRAYRRYSVTFSGVDLPRDATDRALCWVAVGSRNAKGIDSTELRGPGRAEHYLAVPPAPPVFPPEPLKATFPDADDVASFTLEWAAVPTHRTTVYRAGELDLVQMAATRGIATTWRAEDPATLRSAALRAVAPALRDAFRQVSPLLPAGTERFTDTLGGSLATLSFYTTLGRSPSMTPADWPDAPSGFVAVAVPKVPEPSAPSVPRAAWRDGARGIEIEIAVPPEASTAVAGYEIYRTSEAARATDWRRMRPVARIHAGVGAYEPRADGPPAVLVATDTTAPAWSAQFYRVIARAPGTGGAPTGTRSAPSAVVRALAFATDPPAAPVPVSAARVGPDLEFLWTAEAPKNPVGSFRFEVVATAPGHRLTLGRFLADDLRDAADPARFAAIVTEPDGVAPTTEVEISVTDPAGRRSTVRVSIAV